VSYSVIDDLVLQSITGQQGVG